MGSARSVARLDAVLVTALPRAVIFFSAAVKLFVDSADPTEIGACVAAKATAGVTTTAGRLDEAARRAGGTPRDLLAALCAVANGPVCVALAATDHDGI